MDISSFFYELLATLIGVAGGLPIALVADRFIKSFDERKKNKEEQRDLYILLSSLSDTIDKNRAHMFSLIETLEQKTVKASFAIDYSTWESINIEVGKYLQNPELQYRLSNHFTQMKYLVQANDVYHTYFLTKYIMADAMKIIDEEKSEFIKKGKEELKGKDKDYYKKYVNENCSIEDFISDISEYLQAVTKELISDGELIQGEIVRAMRKIKQTYGI
jgi:hypothetical protein